MKINKTALALGSALMLFATTLNAQEQPWSFGVKAGGSLSYLRGLDELFPKKHNGKDWEYKTSGRFFLTGGLTAGYAFHDNVGVGIEVLYAGLGGDLEMSAKLPDSATADQKKANKPLTSRVHSHNLVVPVMLKLFPMGCDSDEGILTVDLGAQAVMPLSVSFETKGSGDKEIDKSKNVNPFTIDAVAGASYEFPEIGLMLELRYHLGFMDFFKNDDEAKTYRKDKLNMEKDKNVSNHYFTLSLGYNLARLLMD